MCDTYVAPASYTVDGHLLFGKNSDRQRNEAHTVELHPPATYARGLQLRCTYILIPQIERTNAVLLCRPFWTWGAEMGANEHGVVIGNEALYAKLAAPQVPALTGMDLVRLALERAPTASAAVGVITNLLEMYGQGGNCGHLVPAFYNNAFIIADATEAFVLDTIGRDWVCERIEHPRAVSNAYSVGQCEVATSTGFPQLLRELAEPDASAANYAEILQDPNLTHIGSAHSRQARIQSLLQRARHEVDIRHFMRIARDHGPASQWDPTQPLPFGACIHARDEDRIAQTTGALISEISADSACHWVTATAAPCISVFKPVLLDTPLPRQGPAPTDRYDPRALWWLHEQMHRVALRGDFPAFLAEINVEREALEASFLARISAARRCTDVEERFRVISACWNEARQAQARWMLRACSRPTTRPISPYDAAWSRMNALAEFTDPCPTTDSSTDIWVSS